MTLVKCIALSYTKFMLKGYSLWMLRLEVMGSLPRPRSTIIEGATMSLNWKSCCVQITYFNGQILRRIFQFVLVSPHFPIFLSAPTWECILVISTNYYQSYNQSVANPHQYLPSRWSWMRGMKRTSEKKFTPKLVVLLYYCTILVT